MRLKVHHHIKLTFEAPSYGLIQTLRMKPRSHGGQFIRSWRLETSEDSRLSVLEDAYGNLAHSFSFEGPIDHVEITCIGDAEVEDRSGLVPEALERLPTGIFLRQTDLTRKGQGIAALAARIETAMSQSQDQLSFVHSTNTALFQRYENAMSQETQIVGAEQALNHKSVHPADLTHILLTTLRHQGFPARMIGGYRCTGNDAEPGDGWHAWAEVLVENIGWVGLDPSQGLSPTDRYVRVAVGLDYLDIMPLRTAPSLAGVFTTEQNASVIQGPY